jgi:hypothetical protein
MAKREDDGSLFSDGTQPCRARYASSFSTFQIGLDAGEENQLELPTKEVGIA